MSKVQGVYIASLDAKDIYLASQLNPEFGYEIKKNGKYKIRKFTNVFDYSLDLIKLRQVFRQVAPTSKFSFWDGGKECCPFVVNVTFKYSVKKFNRVMKGVFVRVGCRVTKDEYDDCVCIRDGQLVGIQIGLPVQHPVDTILLENCFTICKHEDGTVTYEDKTNIPTVHGVRDLRTMLYEDGFMFDGRKYVRFKRSSGSARVGKVLFIDERFYQKMHEWEMCGLKVEDGDPIALAAWESYISLTTSSIVGTLEIKPENILLVDEQFSVFKEKVLVVDSHEGSLRAYADEATISNNIWDGESLIDQSLLPVVSEMKRNDFGEQYEHRYKAGMYLLRSRFFKSAAFNTNIQQFFKDNGITSVEQLNGKTRAKDISDVKIIMTESSIKYLKFGTFDQWLDNLETTFGIVKTEHETHYFSGKLVQAHYQLCNTLQLSYEEVEQFLEPTITYAKALRKNPEVLRFNINYPYDVGDEFYSTIDENDIVFTLMGINADYYKTKLYQEFAKDHAKAYLENAKRGHIMVHGNYSTMVGNPYELLLHSIGKFDGTSRIPAGCIHSTKFEYGKTILGTRSPHVCMGNVLLVKNVADEVLDTYFNLTPEIVCVNSIEAPLEDTLAGCDFDSDQLALIDNDILVRAAEKWYGKFLVPITAVSASNKKLRFTNQDKSELDIATSENLIGVIVNCAQSLNSLFWHNINNGQTLEENFELYSDIAKLSVLSGIEIDKAKRSFDIDSAKEISKIKDKYFPKLPGQKRVKPYFLGVIAKYKGYYDPDKNDYVRFDTTMDYVESVLEQVKLGRSAKGHRLALKDVMAQVPYNSQKVDFKQAKQIIQHIENHINFVVGLWTNEDIDPTGRYLLKADSEQALLTWLQKLKISKDTLIYLLRATEQMTGVKPHKILHLLFLCNNEVIKEFFKTEKQPLSWLVFDPSGEIEYYGYRFNIVQR